MMKKSVKLAIAASVLTTPAMTATAFAQDNVLSRNMENPLYLPARNMFYSKLSNGVMLKVADDSQAHKDKHHDGATEFPIIRIQEEMGYGITDRLAVHGSVQYTHDDDIARTGLSAGRLGATYRILNMYDGFTWDVYGDLHLGGLGQMRGQYNVTAIAPAPAGYLDYDNYSNGMWGFHVGTKFGKTWDRLTTSAFVEVLRTFGDDNSAIRVVGADKTIKISLANMDIPNSIKAEFKSTTEVNAGANVFYQWSDRWSTGAWFRYEHHADQGIKKITTEMSNPYAAGVAKVLEAKLADMDDGFDDYVIGLSAAAQVSTHAQVALYGEYTFDTAHERSQNGTDAKAEVGVRVNFTF